MRPAVLALLALPLAADSWVRVRAGDVTLYSDAAPQRAAAAAQRLDRLQAAFAVLYPAASARPVRVLWFARRAGYEPFAEGPRNSGISYTGPLGEWIVADASAAEPQRVLAHELGHLVWNRLLPDARAPEWLAEGFAEVYSTLEATDREIRAGASVPAHEAVLAERRWVPLDQLDAGSELLYPQGWAMARQLVLREPENFRRFLETREIPPGLEERARNRTATLRTVAWNHVPAAPVSASEPEPRIRLQVADLLFAAGRADAARAALADLARMFPASEEGAIATAFARRGETGPAEARKILEAALARRLAGDRALHVEYIALLEELGEPSEVIEKAMRAALERHPELSSVEHRLGQRLAASGQWAEAVARLRRAAEAEPGNFSFWHAYAWASRQAEGSDQADKAAAHVARLAASARERDMAAALAREPAATLARSAPTPLPEKWQAARGDAAVEGTLVNFICSQPPVLEVETAGVRARFLLADAARTPVRGRESFEFRCGAQRLPVRIEYRRESRAVTAVEVR
jgi:Flp pilus assembly protein TadD